MTDATTYRCRATLDGDRCHYRGTSDELGEHANDAGHARCIICGRALNEYERQVCAVQTDGEKRATCIDRVRDDLAAILSAYSHLERRIEEGAYSGNWLTALSILTDGAIKGGGPDDHVKYRDLWPVVAVLEAADREWREEFGHRVSYKPIGHPDRMLRDVLEECVAYLRSQHALAARTLPGFDAYAATLRTMRSQVEHVVGLADDPVRAPASCFDCGGQLIRTYEDRRGLTDDWTCRTCKRIYDQAAYFLALRSRRDECAGWVPVKVAASVLRIPESTLFRWVARGEVETQRDGGRTFVEWSEVSTLRERRAS